MVEIENREACNVIIVCEDSYGLDVYMIIEAINARSYEKQCPKYKVAGFLTTNYQTLAGYNLPAPNLGTVFDWKSVSNERYILAIRFPGHKEAVVENLKTKGAVFETIIAPWVQHPLKYEHGEGCIIANYIFKYGSKFGNFVIMDTCICESVEIGDYSTLCPFVNITTSTIGKNVYIGTHAAIVSGRKIGDGAIIYPGSMVMSNVKPGAIVAGIPASKNLRNWGKKQDE